MDHFLKLTVSGEDASELAKPFYQTTKKNLVSGLMTTVRKGEDDVPMLKSTKDSKIIYTIPLSRDPLDSEVEKVIYAFETTYGGDYSIASSRSHEGYPEEINIDVDTSALIELCTAWSKRQHDTWMEDKTNQGWRYGTDVSQDDQTHPLIRQWSDLPAKYREVDAAPIEELISFFNDQGYVLVKKIDL